MMMTMDQSSGFSKTDSDVDWSVFENADRYLLRDDSAWITRLGKDFWWNLERISEMTKTTNVVNLPQQILSSSTPRKIVGQHSTISRPNTNNIPEKINSSSIYDQDIEYNPFQSKVSFDNNVWTNFFQQAIPWQ